MIANMKEKYKDSNLLMMIKSKGQLMMKADDIENFEI